MILLCHVLKTRIVSLCYRDQKLEVFDSSRYIKEQWGHHEDVEQKMKDTIFLWNHLLGSPSSSLLIDETANHYSLLELDPTPNESSSYIQFPDRILVKKKKVVDLVTPPRKKLKKEVKS